jgi:hypothetical protein
MNPKTDTDLRQVILWVVDNCREQAAFHSITSSASASSVGGISRPSAFAVLRLMTSMYLVGELDRKVGRLLALKNAVDVTRREPILINQVGSVRNQPARI